MLAGRRQIDRAQQIKEPATGTYRQRSWDELSVWTKRKRVLDEQNNHCNGCGLGEWRGQPLTLELEHKDGNTENNLRENLECLCPNCHSQTPTWRGRNVGGGDEARRRAKITDEQFVAMLKDSKSFYEALGKLGLPQKGKSYSRAKRLAEEHGVALFRPSGHLSACAKLSQEQVQEVRRLREDEKLTQKEIGDLFGVHREVIGNVLRGNTYKNS